jgi:hypothetical protein
MFLDAGSLPDTFHGKSHFASSEPVAVRSKQEIIRLLGRALCYPFIQETFYLGMKRDVSIVMHLSYRYAEPVILANLDDTVGGKIKEFALTHSGQHEGNAAKPSKQVGVISSRLQEFRRGDLIQKFRRGLVQDREVTGKYQYPLGSFRPLPLRDADKEIIQGSQEMIPGRRLQYVSRAV